MLLNRQRAQALMDERQLDGLIAASAENITYATGFANWTIYTFKDLVMFAVIPRDGDISLIAAIDAADYLAQVPSTATRLYTYGTFHIQRRPGVELTGAEAALVALREGANRHPSALAALGQALADSGLSRGRLGLDERAMTPERWRATIEAVPGAAVEEAGDLFRQIRLIKTPAEIEQLRIVVGAVERGIQTAFAAAKPGMTEWELESIFRASVAATGVTPGHFETSAGTRSAGSFPASHEYRLRSGDVIRSDAGGRRQGYWADTGRTAALGDPPDELRRHYDALHQGIEAICGRIKAGTPISDLFDAGVETVRASGIPHYQRHHVGHAIGLEMYEPPVLVGKGGAGDIHKGGSADQRLEENMVINIELPYYELGLGGLQIEDTMVVRANGYDQLTTASRELRSF